MVNESKLDAYIKIAKILSGQSKCSMHKVAAIIINTRTLNIVSIGYNGTPSGYVNCNKLFKKTRDEFCVNMSLANYVDSGIVMNKIWNEVDEQKYKELHHLFSERFEVHAEQNALLKLIGTNCNVDDLCLISTLEPCYQCCKLIIASGIKEVIYIDKYERNSFNARKMLSEFGISCWQYNKS